MKEDVFKTELQYINDNEIREKAKKIINLLPDYFFEVPASSTGKYHPSFSQGEGGLVRHTKVAATIANELLNNNSIIGDAFTPKEKDLIIDIYIPPFLIIAITYIHCITFIVILNYLKFISMHKII